VCGCAAVIIGAEPAGRGAAFFMSGPRGQWRGGVWLVSMVGRPRVLHDLGRVRVFVCGAVFFM